MEFFRKYYRPGMISLIGIPVILFSLYYFRKVEYCIKFNMPERVSKINDTISENNKLGKVVQIDSEPLPPPPPLSNEQYLEKLQTKLKVNLDDKVKLDSILAKYAYYNSDSLCFNNTYEAFHKDIIIEFNSKTTYQQLINVIDACNKNKIYRYAWVLGRDIFIIPFERRMLL